MEWLILVVAATIALLWYYQQPSDSKSIESDLGLSGELTTLKNPPYKGPYEFQPKPDTYELRQKILAAYPDSTITRSIVGDKVRIKITHPDGGAIVGIGADTHEANRALAHKLGVTE